MRLPGSIHRGAVLAVAAAALITGAVLVVRAQTAPPATPESTEVLLGKLAGSSPGGYLDKATGKMVVTVTDRRAAARVRAAGAVARTVKHSGTQLERAMETLDRAARFSGTAWSIDPVTNQVVVYADATVSGGRMSVLDAIAGQLGDLVRVRTMQGSITTRAAGGDGIFGGRVRCSLGFNVTVAGAHYFLTAGHCGKVAKTWFSDAAHTHALGTVVNSRFPGHDYALVRYTGAMTDPRGTVDVFGFGLDITSAGNPFVGQVVGRSGSSSGTHAGTVTALNATVNFPEGTVTGLIQTNVCAEPGDSGGPLFAGSVALGLTSGGSGNCLLGGITFFQPVRAALAAYRATVL